jgi:hypothetical protein
VPLLLLPTDLLLLDLSTVPLVRLLEPPFATPE